MYYGNMVMHLPATEGYGAKGASWLRLCFLFLIPPPFLPLFHLPCIAWDNFFFVRSSCEQDTLRDSEYQNNSWVILIC